MQRIHPEHEDALFAILGFPSGPVALLDINWLTPTKLRELRVTGQHGMFVVDYMSQDLYFYENSYLPLGLGHARPFPWNGGRQRPEDPAAQGRAAPQELQTFVRAASDGRPPEVTGTDGLRALMLAQSLLESSSRRCVIDTRAGEE